MLPSVAVKARKTLKEKINTKNWCLITYPAKIDLINNTTPIYSERAYRILKFRVNWANIEQGTGTQKLKNLWIAGHLC